MKAFKYLPLSAAVFGALYALPAMADNSHKLEEVTVTADRQGLKVKSNVVTAAKKDESVETDLRGLLRHEAAIGIGAGNGTSQYLYIRGMGQNSVDVKIDNAYTDSQIHYHSGRHMLDPALVKIVSVQKGAGSASAGIGQTNGAIIAKTLEAEDLLKNSDNPNLGAKINLGYNSNDGHNYGASVFGKNDRFDFLAALNRVNEDEYKGGKGWANGKDGSARVPFSALDKSSYLLKFGATFDNHRFVLSRMHEQHKGDRTVREEFTVDDTPGSRVNSARQAPANRKMTVDNTNLEWNATDLGFISAANANIYRLVHGRWSADDSGNGYAGGDRNSDATKNEVITTGANLNLDSNITDNLLVKYGINYRNQEVKPNQIFTAGLQNQEKRDVGVYAEAIGEINEFTLTAGLRYDHFNFTAMDGRKRSDGAINPSFGVIFEPTENLTFSASHNYATRSPRMHDALMAHGARGVITIGEQTKAEQARNTEIGFNYNNGTIGLEGNYFWQDIKNALGTTNGRDNHGNSAQEIINGGRIKNKGYELSASYRNGGFTSRLGVAHSTPRFHSQTAMTTNRQGQVVETALLSGNPEYAAAIGRTWTASLAYQFANPNVEVGVHTRAVERVKAENNFFVQGGNLVTGSANGKTGYGIVDITANWKPLNNDKMNVNFAVNNIANKYYIPHWQRSGLPGTGREYRIGMNYTF